MQWAKNVRVRYSTEAIDAVTGLVAFGSYGILTGWQEIGRN